jgi:CRISPR-associated protein Csm1
MNKNLQILQFGAILHDVGKLIRRAGIGTQDHTKEGIKFIKEYLVFESPILNEIEEIVHHHHYAYIKNNNLKNYSLSYIVYEADNISSCIDRREYEESILGNEKSYLNSVFNILKPHIRIDDKKFLTDSIKSTHLNMPRNIEFEATNGNFANLLNIFKVNIKTVESVEDINKLLLLIENVFSYFPSSSYVNRPDISLYDHLKLTSALASCMYLYDNNNKIENFKEEYFENKHSRNINKFLLVSGELSGIQNFIYTISSKMAMKSLRGRSFYLELLTENIIDEILSEFELSRANLIYSGGSHFYMLLPNIDSVKKQLITYKNIINNYLLKREGINLYFELGYTETNANKLGNNMNSQIKNTNLISEMYSHLSKSVTKNKVQRYSKEQLIDLFNEDSIINKIESYEKECSICKKSATESSLASNSLKYDSLSICNECLEYIELGRNISKIYHNDKKEYFFIIKNEKTKNNLELPLINGDSAYIEFIEKDTLSNTMKNSMDNIRIYSINSKYIGENLKTNIWVGNYNVNSYDNNLIEFMDLAKRSKGIKRLGVIRVDVDNLSTIFKNGFENKNEIENKYKYVTFSRTAVLSRYLSDFFKRKINLILERNIKDLNKNEIFKEYSNFISEKEVMNPRDIVIVYSGGDDLFAIGTWNDIIEFSIDFRNAFKEFTNSKITLSAGIGIFPENYPVHQMAKLTGTLETYAKENNNSLKDSIALFGVSTDNNNNEEKHVYTWNRFIDSVVGEKYSFLNNYAVFDEDNINIFPDKIYLGKSSMYKLIELLRNSRKRNNRLDIARFAYLLARIKYSDVQKESYNNLKKQLFKWIKNPLDAEELLTAFIIIIYKYRESEV